MIFRERRTREYGEDVSANYYLEIEGQGLRVNRKYLEISSTSVKREYNGEALTDDTITVTFGSLADGHKLTCNVTGSITDVGYVNNVIENYTVADKDGNDVTYFHEVVTIEGVLEIIQGTLV